MERASNIPLTGWRDERDFVGARVTSVDGDQRGGGGRKDTIHVTLPIGRFFYLHGASAPAPQGEPEPNSKVWNIVFLQ